MQSQRNRLQKVFCNYTKDTLTYIQTVRGFCENFSRWKLVRKDEIVKMTDIKDRADKLDMNISSVFKSDNRGKAFQQYMKNMVSADKMRAELEKELDEVLRHTMEGLEKLSCFLDAVEKLAVTSLEVFTENQVLHLPEGIRTERVQAVITAARYICPLLLEFKRDEKVFFLPKLENVEVLKYQLDRYIQISERICQKLNDSSFSLNTTETVAILNADLSEGDIDHMLCPMYLLDEIRMDMHFRMVFLFSERSCEDFISEFDERQPRMLEFLKDLEQCAVQLNRMKKGAKISSVAGSSVGAAGGVLSIVGLALIPFTAGLSFGLTMTGVGLGVASGVNSIVTTVTEIGVNHRHQNKAGEAFQNFMEDVQSLQNCLQEVANQPVNEIRPLTVKGNLNNLAILNLSGAAAVSGVSAGQVVAQDVRALRNASRVASELPDMGQGAVRGTIALSRSARVGVIALNALFLGMDIAIICIDSRSLANGSESKISQFLRARAALWSSEIESWQKIRDSLAKGLINSERNLEILYRTFYPRRRS